MNRNRSGRPRWRRIVSVCCLTFLASSIGCGGQRHAVKVDVARKTLATTMESWKDGETPEVLRKRSPSIVVQDLDWAKGTKLLDYRILDDGKPVDANLIAKVKLEFEGADGNSTEKIATYVVGTSPVLTVFRNLMH